MRPIQVCLSISKEQHDSCNLPDLDDRIFREAAEMIGRTLLKDGILERHLDPGENGELHYIVRLNVLDKARFLKVLDQWEEHAIRGMRNGATAYHQGKITLITDLRDWITREG